MSGPGPAEARRRYGIEQTTVTALTRPNDARYAWPLPEQVGQHLAGAAAEAQVQHEQGDCNGHHVVTERLDPCAFVEPASLNAADVAVMAGVTRSGVFAGVHRAWPPLPLGRPATHPWQADPASMRRTRSHGDDELSA